MHGPSTPDAVVGMPGAMLLVSSPDRGLLAESHGVSCSLVDMFP